MLFTEASKIFHLASAPLMLIIMSPSLRPSVKFELLFNSTAYKTGILVELLVGVKKPLRNLKSPSQALFTLPYLIISLVMENL